MVFTCVTDTGYLNWKIGLTARQFYYNTDQLNITITKDIFTLILKSITGPGVIFQSTASAMHVSLNYSGQNVTCEDGTDAGTIQIVLSEVRAVETEISMVVV